MRYDTRKIELRVRIRERVRRGVFVPNLRHLLACRRLLLNIRSAVEPCGGRPPLNAGEEPASHFLEVGGGR
jgi:hypothetical protein